MHAAIDALLKTVFYTRSMSKNFSGRQMTRAREAEESPLLEALAKERLVETKQAGCCG
jgi:hypothetical protein